MSNTFSPLNTCSKQLNGQFIYEVTRPSDITDIYSPILIYIYGAVSAPASSYKMPHKWLWSIRELHYQAFLLNKSKSSKVISHLLTEK